MPDSREWTAARDEYTYQLVQSITPDILEIFNKIYEKAQNNTDEDKSDYILVNFQLELQKIPHWNSISVERECKKIINGYPSLMDHVAAVFVSNIQILSCVRLDTDDKKDIHIKIPTRDSFIHKVLIQCAENIYGDPLLFWHKISYGEKRENSRKKQELIGESIQEAIREMLPIQDILKEYLSETGKTPAKKEDPDDASVASKESDAVDSDSSGPDIKDPFYNDSDDDEDTTKHIAVKSSPHDQPENRLPDESTEAGPERLPEGIGSFGKPAEINRPHFNENAGAPTYNSPQHTNNTSSPVSPIYKPAGDPSEFGNRAEPIGVPEKPREFEEQENEKTKWLGDDSDSDTDQSEN
uniref:Uncharacterized protein n=1 Tax=viral metagenome TaxID=1070528 RepID=A0A6C0F8Z5_9ZZZZ|tara:strand:- start:3133 stop:4194 length:1062 start_codon:yes stop_codon:yes gene_type:complete